MVRSPWTNFPRTSSEYRYNAPYAWESGYCFYCPILAIAIYSQKHATCENHDVLLFPFPPLSLTLHMLQQCLLPLRRIHVFVHGMWNCSGGAVQCDQLRGSLRGDSAEGEQQQQQQQPNDDENEHGL